MITRDRANWLLREQLIFGIFEQVSGRLVGGLGLLRPDWEARVFEIGYWLRESAQGHGYMREAVQMLTRHAFDSLGANRVAILMDTRNARSRRVPESLGYVLEGTLRRCHLDVDGQPADQHVFALIGEDYARLDWARGKS